MKSFIILKDYLFRSAELAVPVMRRYYDGHDIVVDFVFGSLRKRFQRDDNGETSFFKLLFKITKFLLILSLGFVKVWTDGCCLNNGWQEARAAIAVSFGINHPWCL